MKKLGLILFSLFILLIGVLAFNYIRYSPKIEKAEISDFDISTLSDYNERIAESIRFKTISYEDTSQIDYGEFLKFHQFLMLSYPAVFENLELEVINHYSLLLKWKGKDNELKPGVLMAHQDVVPVAKETEKLWKYPAFDGIISNDTLFGRGSVDNKINLMSQLEAVNYLVQNEFQPQRDIYFVFGHDEEIGGKQGALEVAKHLLAKGIQADFVLDEGGFVSSTLVPGITQPVAMIGTSEKGQIDVELSVSLDGGHASMPEKENAVSVLSKAIADINKNQFRPSLSTSVNDFLDHIAPYAGFVNRLAMSNRWLFKPLIFNTYSKTAPADASIRTTIAPTIVKAGVKNNVVPDVATANINIRIIPGTSIEEVANHIRKAVNNPLVEVRVVEGGQEASAVSPINTSHFQHIVNCVEANFEEVIASPFLMIASTDSRHFDLISENIYKFSPMINPSAFHGVNEYLDLKTYPKAIGFYVDFLKAL